MNKFIGIGRWAKDIELRYTPQGKAVASSTIAINERYGDKENTTFLPVTMWNKVAEVVAEHSRKGRLVAIEGKISVRNYENNEGRRVYITEVVADNVRFLESSRSESGGQANKQSNADPFADDGHPINISSDDLPF